MRTDNALLNHPLWEQAGAQPQKAATANFANTLAAAKAANVGTSFQELSQTDTDKSEGQSNGIDIKGLEALAAGATHYWQHLGKAVEPMIIQAPLAPAVESPCAFHTPTEAKADPQAGPSQLEQTIASAAAQALGHWDSASYLETLFKREVTAPTTH